MKLKDFKKVFINPIIEDEKGTEWPFSEGCLSIPGSGKMLQENPRLVLAILMKIGHFMKKHTKELQLE